MILNFEEKKLKARSVEDRLAPLYGNTKSLLVWHTPFELVVATILSAQCTDAMVNRTTPALFEHFPTPEALAVADVGDVSELIKSIGFFRVKAAHIVQTARLLVDEYHSIVPSEFADLLRFPGVGRKTANVVRYHVFNKSAIIVDTHARRVSQRLALTEQQAPEKIEKELQTLLSEERWSSFSMEINVHGRLTCKARKPLCENCIIRDICGR